MGLDKKLQRDFSGMWYRALQLPSLSQLTAATVANWAAEKGLAVHQAVERDVGAFPIPAVVLTVDAGTAYFPKVAAADDATWLANKQRCEHRASLWAKVEWFEPLWADSIKVETLLSDVQHRPKESAIKLFEYHTSTLYTLPFQAICIAQFIPKSRSLEAFAPIAREAYLAFYAGYRASSIAALIPVLEGALKRISDNHARLPVPEQINRLIDEACAVAGRDHFDRNWIPDAYCSRDYLYGQNALVFTFETFRQWLKQVFFQQTEDYTGLTWLNRHLFAHGASMEWSNAGNFQRLVVALATLGAIESYHDQSNNVPLRLPDMNEDSRLLWQQALLQAQGQMALKQVEQKNYRKHGRLVPPMPTDNGVLLRKAILKQECIKELVRPLRRAGWSIKVGEPDERALYMKVVATSEEAVLRVVFLYSCGTANALYKELEKDSDAILYAGAPYNQESYAYGINVHVGPVTGWQPPVAPGRNTKTNSARSINALTLVANWLASVKARRGG